MKQDYESKQQKDHNTRRATLLEIAAIYGLLIVALVWNWW